MALVPALYACNEDYEETTVAEKEGSDIYALDGKITTMQTATVGNGVNIVLMGDGYTAEDISAGEYDEAMEKALETIFSISPMSGLRDYFNVYSVQKVSVSSAMDGSSAFGVITSNGSTTATPSLSAAGEKAIYYASDVPGFSESNTVICVVVNTELGRGVTSHLTEGWDDGLLACSYAPHKGDYDGYDFKQRLIHELVGHAIGKLADEYSPDGGSYTNSMMNRYIYGQSVGWWYQNIWIYDAYDYTTPWDDFLNDSQYADEELANPYNWDDDFNDKYYIGTNASGTNYAYRATENSIMQSTAEGTTFNAPSRRAIYNNVMRTATGTTPTYAEFVAFDQKNQ